MQTWLSCYVLAHLTDAPLPHLIGKVVVKLLEVIQLRRVPSLVWFTHSLRFRALHKSVVSWIEQNFKLIEGNTDWLNLIRQETTDFCETSLGTNQWHIPRDPPSVECHRTVRKVYGVDGLLRERLAGLAAALEAVGWSHLRGRNAIAELADQHSPARVGWRPVPHFTMPAGLEMMPPAQQWPSWRWLHMDIEWMADTQIPDLTPVDAASMTSARRRSPLYWPVEHTTAGQTSDPVAGAFSGYRHEHEIAIKIRFTYYNNTNPNRPHGWMVKRLLPIVESRHRGEW